MRTNELVHGKPLEQGPPSTWEMPRGCAWRSARETEGSTTSQDRVQAGPRRKWHRTLGGTWREGSLEQGIVQKTREQRLKFKEVEEGEGRASQQRQQHGQSDEALVPNSGVHTHLGALKNADPQAPH